jgi:L-rhamnose isomerase
MYSEAKKKFAAYGVDTDQAIKTLKNLAISVHCWQGDDVLGFQNGGALSGGIQTTGNYPGRARNFAELKQDIEEAFSLMPGKKRLNLHAIYAVTEKPVPMDQLTPKDFKAWMDWSKEKAVPLDFNPTFFSNPMVKDGLTLSSPDEEEAILGSAWQSLPGHRGCLRQSPRQPFLMQHLDPGWPQGHPGRSFGTPSPAQKVAR